MPRNDSPDSDWLDDQNPHDQQRSRAQVDGLLQLLGSSPCKVLDLGCGIGRTLVPLAKVGHHLTGFDRDQRAISRCAYSLRQAGSSARLINADFTDASSVFEPCNAVTCLGNTVMTIVDVDAAADLLMRVTRSLTSDGMFILDDVPHEFWPEVAEGNWVSGISQDGATQLVWAHGDSVFTIRRGADIDPSGWTLKASDRRYRLWCEGSLRLLARVVGLSAPMRLAQSGLIVMHRQPAGSPGP